MLVAAGPASAGSTHERFEFSSYSEVDALFNKLNYTPETWQQGVRAVPRVYLTEIPARWRDSVAPNISVETKKRIFFRALAPLVLRANELIAQERERLKRISEDRALMQRERSWLQALAERYKVGGDSSTPLGDSDLEELLVRVDVIPTSLVLAQAAEESGWGTSRFAAQGNALFGQWTWGGAGIQPEQQRQSLGDYKIAAFDSPQESVSAYAHNLNTHSAYAPLRQRRASLRADGQPLTGRALVNTLTSYSERGEEYVESLQAIIRVNKLAPADDAYLLDMTPIDLVPVGAGVVPASD
ncbi:MAG: hypothetical protein AMJ69_04745 [Gammaproteobacteria bacterium SG8_47]|nr:MAG: hypothetical protein AMJ69_04745 [Gammaproteobacteria bacterium SG8_47]